MTSKLINLLLIVLFMGTAFSAQAVLMLRPEPVKSQSSIKAELNAGALTIDQKKNNFKQHYLKKISKEVGRRIAKMNNSYGNIFSSKRFRWGAVLLLLGIIGALLVNLLSLAQIFGWLSGLLALTGLILMILALIEYS